ncbi:MAG: hypothetical protein A2Y74_06150 [Actinobacteria bacterium RBG_13_63_9]|nr:MAG: hypothetical protein A2Y74_06150 [Actinobacteria bacterium RBG_13_63_9]
MQGGNEKPRANIGEGPFQNVQGRERWSNLSYGRGFSRRLRREILWMVRFNCQARLQRGFSGGRSDRRHLRSRARCGEDKPEQNGGDSEVPHGTFSSQESGKPGTAA